jgi:acyl phosphate:glycerol-3-phosphate acyltransferase
VTADALIVAAGYLMGGIPFAFLLARRYGGVDLRRVGSGNLGAANALRSTNPRTAALVTLLDVGKGAAAVYGASLAGASNEVRVAAGVAAILGHIYSVWLGWRGGKGVATACGVFALLAPRATATALLLFMVTVWRTRYVSIASIAAVIALPLLVWARGDDPAVLIGAAVVAALIVFKHRANIARLRAGVERRLGERA